jgi:hypothetical protein
MRPDLQKPFIKIRLVEWLKVKALSSSLSTEKKKTCTFPLALLMIEKSNGNPFPITHSLVHNHFSEFGL